MNFFNNKKEEDEEQFVKHDTKETVIFTVRHILLHLQKRFLCDLQIYIFGQNIPLKLQH